jgi:hypothetical protein
MEEELLRLMDEYGLIEPAAEYWQVLIQSFSAESLQKIHELEPSLPLMQLYSDEETSESIQARLAEASTYAVGIGPSKTDVDAALVEAAHAFCLDVHPYTVNETAEMEALIALGLTACSRTSPTGSKSCSARAQRTANRARSLALKTTRPAAPPLNERRDRLGTRANRENDEYALSALFALSVV